MKTEYVVEVAEQAIQSHIPTPISTKMVMHAYQVIVACQHPPPLPACYTLPFTIPTSSKISKMKDEGSI